MSINKKSIPSEKIIKPNVKRSVKLCAAPIMRGLLLIEERVKKRRTGNE